MFDTTLALLPMSTGIFDWFNEKNASALSAARGLSVTLAVAFVIWSAISSKLAAARIIVALLIAGLFVWGVFSVTQIKDRVGNEMGSGSLVTAPALVHHSTT